MKKEKQITEKEGKDILNFLSYRAERIIDDKDKINDLLDKGITLIKETKSDKKNKLNEVIEDIDLMISLVKSYIKKEYKEVPIRTILLVVASIIYLVTPIDVIPDITPIIGFSDDIFIIGLCLKSVDKDLKLYKEWKKDNK